jgi:hypothetical protein
MQDNHDDNHSQNVDSCAETRKLLVSCNNQTSTQHSPQNNPTWQQTAGYLQHLCNKYGDFKVTRAWKNKEGDLVWSKHRNVMELWEQGEKGIWWLGHCNNRQILPHEIVIDLDDNPTVEKLNIICDELENKGHKYKAYFTGSKGYHIHVTSIDYFYLNKRLKEQVRLDMIQEFGGDTHKKNEVMIALEDVSHWKTGQSKKMIRCYPLE